MPFQRYKIASRARKRHLKQRPFIDANGKNSVAELLIHTETLVNSNHLVKKELMKDDRGKDAIFLWLNHTLMCFMTSSANNVPIPQYTKFLFVAIINLLVDDVVVAMEHGEGWHRTKRALEYAMQFCGNNPYCNSGYLLATSAKRAINIYSLVTSNRRCVRRDGWAITRWRLWIASLAINKDGTDGTNSNGHNFADRVKLVENRKSHWKVGFSPGPNHGKEAVIIGTTTAYVIVAKLETLHLPVDLIIAKKKLTSNWNVHRTETVLPRRDCRIGNKTRAKSRRQRRRH